MANQLLKYSSFFGDFQKDSDEEGFLEKFEINFQSISFGILIWSLLDSTVNQKCYFAEYKRLDKFFVENSTLAVADSEIVIDIFKHCVSINLNLLERRDLTILNTDLTTARIDTDVVMQESVLPRVSETPGSSSFVNLILSRAETHMYNWELASCNKNHAGIPRFW